ncbi:MAG: hypothetical protein JJE34_08755 [Alphaproteobacteria bacterium]|nr:hypothetical protein [Alphaproteobacteria bacterium]
MFHIVASCIFAGAFVAAMTVITVMFFAYRDKMIAALTFQASSRCIAPWQVPVRRSARTVRSVSLTRTRFSRPSADAFNPAAA